MSTLREALSKAYDQSVAGGEAEESAPVEAHQEAAPVESESAPTVEAESAPSLADKPAPKAEGRDEKGRFAPKAKEAAPVAPVVAALKPGQVAVPVTKPVEAGEPILVPPAAPPVEAIKAPQSWKPGIREKFATLPPEVQQEVLRREKEITSAFNESAQARKLASEFQQVFQPYEAMIRAEGGEPLKVVGSLLQTAAALRTAPPAHKAQLVAKLVQDFGVPIEALDAALSGQAPAPQAQQPAQYRDPRFDQFLSTLEQRAAQKRQAEQAKALESLQQFAAKAEFFEDVREDMADLIDVAARRGVELTAEQAYNRACQMHPEVSKVLAQRQAAQSAATATAATQRAKDAASSVRSTPSGPAVKGKPDSLRGALEAAWETHSGR